jgi:D-psicose/D-tagatose/L-ribulose 3-epimerase
MKIGMNLLLWTDEPSCEHIALIERIKEWGFDGVEFQVDAMKEKDVNCIADVMKDLNMGVTCIAAMPVDLGNHASPIKQEREKAVDYIKHCVDISSALGSKVLGGPLTQGLGTFTGAGPTEQEKDWVAESLYRVADYSKKLDVRIALEPINRFEAYMANTVDMMLEIIDRVDSEYVGIHVDTHHGNIEELDICSAWEKAGDKIFLVHISENTRGIPGTGPGAPKKVFDTLLKIGYEGWLTIEAFNTSVKGLIPRLHLWRRFTENDEDIAIQGLSYIRKQLGLEL